jgi:hypothetical protein
MALWTRPLAALVAILAGTSMAACSSAPPPTAASPVAQAPVKPDTRFQVTLEVHESAPTEDVRIPRASVTAVDPVGTTVSGETDGSGTLVLRLHGGQTHLTTAAGGYETSRASVNVVAPDAIVSLPLVPAFREIRESFAYVYPPPVQPIAQKTFRVNVHHAGSLNARYTETWRGASEQAASCLEVRDSSGRVLASSQGIYDNWAPDLVVSVSAGQAYEVRFFVCGAPSYTPSTMAAWGGEVRHPS